MSAKQNFVSFSGGEISIWIEQQDSICLKAVTAFGDPVELTADEARKIAKFLMNYAEMTDEH